MICYPNAKINIGLKIMGKRPDGFHDIESVFYPIPLFDVMEIKEADNFGIESLGQMKSRDFENNLIYKTWLSIKTEYDLPAFKIKLLKNIPAGAGLGGGSSDASFFLKTINENYKLGLSNEKLKEIILKIGSDCPFFIDNKAALVSGRGEILKQLDFKLPSKHISIVKPGFSISTARAFSILKPQKNPGNFESLINRPVNDWKDLIFNDFESLDLKEMQKVVKIKNTLYDVGADFVLMSGSGSAVFALSDNKLKINNLKKDNFVRQLAIIDN